MRPRLGRFDHPGSVDAARLRRRPLFAPRCRASLPQTALSVANLAAALAQHEPAARAAPRQACADSRQDAFAAVNTAFLQRRRVDPCRRATRNSGAPIHLLFVATRSDSAALSARVLVVAESGSRVHARSRISSRCRRRVPHQRGDAKSSSARTPASPMSGCSARAQALSISPLLRCAWRAMRRYSNWTIALGARISRHNLNVAQAGEGTEFSVDGLALIGGRQLADTHSCIDHAHPHGTQPAVAQDASSGGGAHAVFNGKILVRQGAQQTDSGAADRATCCSPTRRTSTPSRSSRFLPTTSNARTAPPSASSTPSSCFI